MLAETIQKTDHPLTNEPRERYATYIPSALLLLMAVDNGWDIVKIKSEPSWDQHGFVYLVTLKCHSEGDEQELIIPKSAIVEKIFEQRAPALASGC